MHPEEHTPQTPSDNPYEFSQEQEPLLKPGQTDPVMWCITFLIIWYLISRLG